MNLNELKWKPIIIKPYQETESNSKQVPNHPLVLFEIGDNFFFLKTFKKTLEETEELSKKEGKTRIQILINEYLLKDQTFKDQRCLTRSELLFDTSRIYTMNKTEFNRLFKINKFQNIITEIRRIDLRSQSLIIKTLLDNLESKTCSLIKLNAYNFFLYWEDVSFSQTEVISLKEGYSFEEELDKLSWQELSSYDKETAIYLEKTFTSLFKLAQEELFTIEEMINKILVNNKLEEYYNLNKTYQLNLSWKTLETVANQAVEEDFEKASYSSLSEDLNASTPSTRLLKLQTTRYDELHNQLVWLKKIIKKTENNQLLWNEVEPLYLTSLKTYLEMEPIKRLAFENKVTTFYQNTLEIYRFYQSAK